MDFHSSGILISAAPRYSKDSGGRCSQWQAYSLSTCPYGRPGYQPQSLCAIIITELHPFRFWVETGNRRCDPG